MPVCMWREIRGQSRVVSFSGAVTLIFFFQMYSLTVLELDIPNRGDCPASDLSFSASSGLK